MFSEPAHTIEDSIGLNSLKLQQVGAEISENQKLQQVGAEIEFPAIFGFVPWRHHVEIVTKCKTIEEALFYVRKTIEESWSRSTLVDCIKADLYQSSGNALTNFAEKLPAIQGKLAQEIVKDTYDFGFVSLSVGYDEEEFRKKYRYDFHLQDVENAIDVLQGHFVSKEGEYQKFGHISYFKSADNDRGKSSMKTIRVVAAIICDHMDNPSKTFATARGYGV